MSRAAAYALLTDLAAVMVFVAIGRRSHEESGNVALGALRVAAPFAIALVAAWALAGAWTAPISAKSGVLVWLITVALGMVLRRFVFDRGTAIAFVIVATVTLALFLQGWRALGRWRHP